MLGGINYANSQISSIYNAGSQQLAETLTRIASGKKFQNASEDLIGYLRSQRLETDISGYEEVRENLTTYKMYTSTAVSSASTIYENLSRMKELSVMYDTADADHQAEYSAEFTALKTQVETALTSTYVDGVAVATDTGMESLDPVDLDPDGNGTLTFSFTAEMPTTGGGGDIEGLVITTADGTDIDTELTQVMTFLEEAKAYDAIIDQQLTINETVINSKQAVKSLITDIDEAEEMSNVLDLSLRQQASVAMLAQGNFMKDALNKLYGF
jgi:flagellin